MGAKRLAFVVVVLALLTGAPALAAPANDNFAGATTIGATPFEQTVSNSGATSEAGEPSPCGAMNSTIWYRYDATASGLFSVTTAGSDFNTVLAVYSGTSLDALTLIECNNDAAQYAGHPQSMVGFVAEPGTTYYIQAGSGYYGDQGNLRLRMSFGVHVTVNEPVFGQPDSAGAQLDPNYQEADADVFGYTFVGSGTVVVRDGAVGEGKVCVIPGIILICTP